MIIDQDIGNGCYTVKNCKHIVALRCREDVKILWWHHINILLKRENEFCFLKRLYPLSEKQYDNSKLIFELNEISKYSKYQKLVTKADIKKLKPFPQYKFIHDFIKMNDNLLIKKYLWDLHSLNWMISDNGTLVLTDPFVRNYF